MSTAGRAGLVAFAVVLFAGTWVGARAWFAKSELEQAQALVFALQDQIATGEYDGVIDGYDAIRDHTSTARGLTDDRLWSLAEQLPLLGANLGALREITWIIDDAMVAAAPLAALASSLDLAALAPQDGAVPMEPFITAATEVPIAASVFATLGERLDDVSTDGTVSQIGDAKVLLSGVLADAASALNEAAPMVRVLPALLGADGTRTYVVMFMNNAELRSLGGTALSFAEITVDNGRIALTKQVPAGEGNFPHHEVSLIPVLEDFEDIYVNALGRFVANATIRPSAETAAQIIQAEWEVKYGTSVDGIVAMDAGALSALLTATDPITLSTGDVVSADNVASLLLNTVYTRYNSGDLEADDRSQSAVYDETLALTFARLSSGQFEPMTLFSSMGAAAAEKRFSIWFADEGERTALANTGFTAGGLPVSTETEDVVGVYLNDQVGSKLNYYLGSRVTSGSAVCAQDDRQVHRVTLTLSSLLTPEEVASLSPSITGVAYPRLGLERAAQRLLIFFYLPPGATLLSTELDGASVASTEQSDADHPVQSVWVTLPPGGTSEVTVDLLMETPGVRTLVTDYTPTINGVERVTAPLDCSTVALP